MRRICPSSRLVVHRGHPVAGPSSWRAAERIGFGLRSGPCSSIPSYQSVCPTSQSQHTDVVYPSAYAAARSCGVSSSHFTLQYCGASPSSHASCVYPSTRAAWRSSGNSSSHRSLSFPSLGPVPSLPGGGVPSWRSIAAVSAFAITSRACAVLYASLSHPSGLYPRYCAAALARIEIRRHGSVNAYGVSPPSQPSAVKPSDSAAWRSFSFMSAQFRSFAASPLGCGGDGGRWHSSCASFAISAMSLSIPSSAISSIRFSVLSRKEFSSSQICCVYLQRGRRRGVRAVGSCACV